MIKLFIYLQFFFSYSYSQNYNDYIHKNYYCITNDFLYTLIIQEDEYIFYGDKGGVLRTYDGGISWNQNYIGTHHFINNMIYYNRVLYGVTSGGELIISSDKGFTWKIDKINNNNLSKIIINENTIYIISNSNEILFSNNNGLTFNSFYKSTNQTISDLFAYKDRLYLKLIDNTTEINNYLIESLDNGNSWYNKELPSSNYNKKFNLKVKENRVIMFTDNSFSILEQDYSLKNYNVNEELIYDLDFNDDNVYLVNSQTDSLTFNISLYSLEDKIIKEKYQHKRLGLMPNQYIINNFKVDRDNLIITSNQKTIVKFDNKGKTPNILSSYIRTQSDTPYYLDSNNWYFTSDLENNGVGGNFIVSKNKGKTFEFSKYFFNDSTRTFCDNNNGYPTNLIFDKNYNLLFSVRFASICKAKYYPYHSYKSTNELNKIEPLIEYSEIGAGDRKKIIKSYDSNHIYYYLHELNNKVMFYNLNNKYESTLLSEIDSITFSNSYLGLYFYFEEDDIYLLGSNSDNSNHNIYLYKSNDLCKSWELELKYEIEVYEYPVAFTKSYNGKFYIILSHALKSFRFLEIDIENKSVKSLNYSGNQNILNGSFLVGNFNSRKFVFDDSMLFEDYRYIHTTVKEVRPNVFKKNYYEAKLLIKNNEVIVDSIINLPDEYIKFKTEFDSLDLYMKSKSNDIYIPIEDKSLITSVDIAQPPSIWTYPPYPNPVKDRLKMKFYSAIMGQIATLKVELIEIGSGRVYNITDYKLSKTDDYFGEIDINISNYNSGAYLINFKLGESNKSESIIIE